ncbi:MAG: hypothetical protein ABEJ89_09645 [Haloarculaceae archaeon]
MTRVGAALRAGVREYRRTPVLLALLVALPAYAIWVFAVVAPDTAAPLALDGGTVRVALGEALPAFMTPMVAALVTGIAGLFVMQTAAETDARLVVAGYRPVELVLARLGLLLGVSALATAVSVGVMLTAFDPKHLAWFAGATALTALIYGMVGVLAGVALDRLPGVYLILFGALVDLFLFQNPLATDPPALATYLPGHFPLQLATQAGFAASVDFGSLPGALVALVALTALATVAFYRSMAV